MRRVSPAGYAALAGMRTPQSVSVARLVVVLAVALSGCGSPPDSSTNSPPAPGTAPQQANQPRTKLVAWAPNFGPISQDAPPGQRWYQQVQDQQCTNLLGLVGEADSGAVDLDKSLYGGLANACKGSWDKARAALNKIDPEDLVDQDGHPDCLMRTTFDTLKRLVDAHESEPDVIVRISGRAAPTCQPPPGTLAGPGDHAS